MPQESVERRFYQLVPANSQVTQDYVIPNGATAIIEFGATTPTANAEVATIIFDPAGVPEVIFSCSGNFSGRTSKPYVGNGVKIIRITLANTAPVDQYMGAYFSGELTV